ncbi:MAG: hypothetical protein NDP24_00400 [Crenarchaeota archaeon]|nr:hypothetical protein [Thermoproteota archaeon]MCR8472206.1 hypothetical protein [Thermoproteota archaeon]MCR8473829.1 hypothetical protein [Thermoproteota archaeon]MCR8489110.1 hypothetical protein [Thermoproteota archaeon]
MSFDSALVDELDVLIVNVDSFLAILAGLSSQLENMGLKDVATRLRNVENAIKEQKMALERFKEKFEATRLDVEAKLGALESEKFKLESRVKELEDALNSMQSERNELIKNLEEKERVLREQEARINELNDKVGRLEELKRTYEAELLAKDRLISEKDEIINKRGLELEELRRSFDLLKQQYEVDTSDLKAKIKELEDNLKTKIGELEDLKKQLEEKSTELRAIASKYEREVAIIPIAKALLITHPEIATLRTIPMIAEIGSEEGEFICIDGATYSLKTKRPAASLVRILEETFAKDWYEITHGIPPKICIKKTIIEALRLLS